MKVSLTQDNQGQTIVWAHKTQRATFFNAVSVVGVAPFALLFVFPYFWPFVFITLNLIVDIIRTSTRSIRITDLLKRLRVWLNGGYWHVSIKNRQRQIRRATMHYPETLID